ncbi:alpha-ketoglutarate-dependent dioxygenase AlkB family protein [Foetidibacter luteolus]|uniref:alpha-ketoglutarate-dependent dioxygenase AlkB family protein n=1 Tax=Foetidibacter luteolus TaxID=2608880 RepID=UPI00129ADDA1|nr:alpha-ketoglutarate-dependent dioxygenase AlkB [Foetidibacter luteolus]
MQQELFNSTTENLLPFDGEVYFYPAFFNKAESDHYLKNILANIQWKQEPIKIFGKTLMQPRLTAWYGDATKKYSYSGITMQPLPWTPDLIAIKQKIETIAAVNFTSALLNLYRNGQDSMGWHRDNEPELGINPVIGSVSFGDARMFKLRNYADKKIIRQAILTHGSFLLMKGATQHYWEHQVPKTNAALKERINITFRIIN